MIQINNDLRDVCYQNACEHGFHDKEYSDEHWLMLIITEIGEAVNAHRSGKRARKDMFLELQKHDSSYQKQDKKMAEKFFRRVFEDYIKNTVEDELADVVIRCLDYAGLKRFDLPPLIDTSLYDLSFTECMYSVIQQLTKSPLRTVDGHSLMIVISTVLKEANNIGIDLLWFIEQKMRYNKTRERIHGKLY